ncbi:hypothetical protein [Sphingobium sp. CAP-1]|uniref:hypothetical protein n=1 Tax=Sphingobium sp. CAP-1 TaxID=2676077 RepID=UPI0012BB3CF8|nr:hypothetical protein [Sphingobium sp. CAP-1]QGP79823.1 hypothetical protein GL174_13160 [Sphingobium sp. CAP-1]
MFDYLGVLISVVLGLALTQLLTGVGRLVELRGSVRIYWVQLLWVFNIIFYVLAIWWGMFWWRGLHQWTFEAFLFLVAFSALLYLLASSLFPTELKVGTDMAAHFDRNRRWFFGLLLACDLIDIPETLMKDAAHLRDVPAQYAAFMAASVALDLAGIALEQRRAQAAIVCLWVMLNIGYTDFTAVARIVMR